MAPSHDGMLADQLVKAQGLTVKARHDPHWLLASLPWHAVSDGPFPGHGCASDRETAVTIAAMESVERESQFGKRHVDVVTIDSAAALGDCAVDVRTFGLYSDEQYRRWGTELSPFSPSRPVAWVAATRLRDSREVLVPLEMVHPRAATPGPPLAFETSSGTAAGFSPDAALASALCEAVERDAALLWWYARTMTTHLDLSESAGIVEDLRMLTTARFVVVPRLLSTITGLSVVMLIVLRGAQSAIGFGCALTL